MVNKWLYLVVWNMCFPDLLGKQSQLTNMFQGVVTTNHMVYGRYIFLVFMKRTSTKEPKVALTMGPKRVVGQFCSPVFPRDTIFHTIKLLNPITAGGSNHGILKPLAPCDTCKLVDPSVGSEKPCRWHVAIPYAPCIVYLLTFGWCWEPMLVYILTWSIRVCWSFRGLQKANNNMQLLVTLHLTVKPGKAELRLCPGEAIRLPCARQTSKTSRTSPWSPDALKLEGFIWPLSDHELTLKGVVSTSHPPLATVSNQRDMFQGFSGMVSRWITWPRSSTGWIEAAQRLYTMTVRYLLTV